MITINEPTVSQQLRKMAVDLDADFFEDYGASKLLLDNDNGKGYINSYDISSNLKVRTYNIKFKKEVRFTKTDLGSNIVYFLYNIKGYFYHKFEDEDDLHKVGQMQNVVLATDSGRKHVVVFPADVELKISVVFLVQIDGSLQETESLNNLFFLKTVNDAIDYIRIHVNDRYFGEIDTGTAKFAKLLIENNNTDIVGRFFCKAASINTLASQLENYKSQSTTAGFSSPIDSEELDKIIEMSTYIGENLDKNLAISHLSEKSGLSPKKLQQGFRFLFGETINNFIKNVRLEHSKFLIQSTNLNISEVCFAIGFNSRSYFSKIFSERFGMHPSEFKQSFLHEDVIFELSYRSKKSRGTSELDVKDILDISRQKNQRKHITGCLVSYKEHFFQIIEGNKSDILDLYETLKKDARHYGIKLLHKGAKTQRLFGDFHMAALSRPDDFKININGQMKDINFSQMTSEMKEPGVTSDIFWMRVCNMLKVCD